MADIIDTANDLVELNLQHTLSNLTKQVGISLAECSECGNPIPQQRQALGGIKLCVECASALEARNKHRRSST